MKAKKSLGQNFLKSIPALNKIIEAGEIKSGDTILEIGPGKGVLTKKLLEKAGKVIAVEKDYELFDFLKEKFTEEIKNGTLILIQDDILEFNPEKNNLKTNSYKIIANIPYNITGAIFKKFLTEKNHPDKMVLMVQNEVAKRVVANDGKESVLSISVKAYGEPKYIMKVPARYFSPAPKVDSAVIAINNINHQMFEKHNISEEKFWEVVKAGFAHKRKKLSSNLKNLIPLKGIQNMSLENKRAENLSLEGWLLILKQ